MLQDVNTAVSICFVVSIDKDSLGTFTGCEGLGCEVVIETREEGGNNDFVWQLPTKLKYSNVKLTRPLGRDTEKVAKWFASMATGFKRTTATVEARRANGKPVATWSLYGVVPVRWSGPSLSADSAKILTETVEIAHQGFVAQGRGA